MVKGKKGQHGVGLAINVEIVKKAGEDGIIIECISARLLKARISIQSSYVRSSLRPDRGSAGGAEGQIHGSPQLHHGISTRSGIRLRSYRRERQDREERWGRRRNRQQSIGRIWPRQTQRKRQTTAGFRRIQQARFSEHFLLHPQKWGVLYVPERQPQQGTGTFGLYPDKAGGPPTHPLLRRPPLEAPESDHNLVYAKVRIPRRSAPNRRKRDSTKETPKLADLRQLMTDPNLRCQVANAMVDALPPIPDGICIGDIATDMADAMLSTAAESVPHSKRPRGAQGWCAGPGVEAEMNAAWQQREEARRHIRAEPHNSNLRKVVKMAGKNLRKVRKAAMLSFFLNFFWKFKTRPREGDQAGFYKHLKTMKLEGKRDRSSAYVKDEDVELIRERWVRWFQTLLNAKSPRLDPNIAEGFDQWPENMPLGVQPTMQELKDAIRSLAKGKAVGPDEVPVELFKITLDGDPALCRRLLDIVVRIWRGGRGAAAAVERCHHHGTPQKEGSDRVRQLQGHLAGSARRQDTAEDHRSPPQRVL